MDNHNEILLLAVSLSLGLLIGIERGWQEREAEEGSRVAGVRTYGLISLLGGLAALIGKQLGWAALGLMFLAVAVVLVTVYVVNLRRSEDSGITSLVAGLLSFNLGALVILGYAMEAAAAAVITTIILGFKPVLHGWLRRLEPHELRAALKLLLISVVLLPVLPNQGYGPWQALNPYELWWMVVLIAGISFTGYFSMKIAGTGKGAILTGLFAGLASSTALTLHFSRLARARPEIRPALVPGILIACATLFPRMLLITAVINRQLFYDLLIPGLLMFMIMLVPTLLWWREGSTIQHESARIKNPLDLAATLRFGMLLAVIMLLAEGLRLAWGEAGIYLLAATSGVADVDAVNLSLARMSLDGLSVDIARDGILIAVSVNTAVKGLLASSIGGRKLILPVTIPLLVAATAGLVYVLGESTFLSAVTDGVS
jgi:uncharacterized membrane protein (DUF4010 family)